MESAGKQANKMAPIVSFSVWIKEDISMGLAVKVHKKTRNMESILLLCGVTELKSGLCCLNVSKRTFNDICE